MKYRKWQVKLHFNLSLWGIPFALRVDNGLGGPKGLKCFYTDISILCFQLSIDYDEEGIYA